MKQNAHFMRLNKMKPVYVCPKKYEFKLCTVWMISLSFWQQEFTVKSRVEKLYLQEFTFDHLSSFGVP